MPTSTDRAGGFTLLEVLIGLAIMALALVAVAPLVSGPGAGIEVKSAGSRIVDAAREAREIAIRTNRPVSLDLNVATRNLRLDGSDPIALGSEELNVSITTAQSLIADSEAGRIVFFPNGSSSGGAISLERGGIAQTYRIDWITGKIRRERASGE